MTDFAIRCFVRQFALAIERKIMHQFPRNAEFLGKPLCTEAALVTIVIVELLKMSLCCLICLDLLFLESCKGESTQRYRNLSACVVLAASPIVLGRSSILYPCSYAATSFVVGLSTCSPPQQLLSVAYWANPLASLGGNLTKPGRLCTSSTRIES